MATNLYDYDLNWNSFFQSLLDLLDGIESTLDDQPLDVDEHLTVRIELAIRALQHVRCGSTLSGLTATTETFLQNLLRNFRLIYLQLNRRGRSRCTSLAVYSVDMPTVQRSGTPGRPKFEISEDVLVQLRSWGFSWKNVAEMLLVSRWTIYRRVLEYGLQGITGFSTLTNEELDEIVRAFMQQHGTLVGYSLVSGHLKALNLRVQRKRIRESLGRVDPENRRIRWAIVVSRRSYSVRAPNSLWHLDGHHSLVTWGFVIHGSIDGYSRLITFLKCSTNNYSETVTSLFLTATARYGWPSRVRTDYGGENVGVWQVMEERQGQERGSYLVGSSTRNQRIERLWRDVFQTVTHIFYYTFQSMEESGVFISEDPLHKFVLHCVFLPRINRALESFANAWNEHPLRTEQNWSPIRIWTNGMLDVANHNTRAAVDVVGAMPSDEIIEDLEWYGYDPNAPSPGDDGLSSVEVNDVQVEHDLVNHLREEINPMRESLHYGIDIFQNALDCAVQFLA